jgi:hypothetical protein
MNFVKVLLPRKRGAEKSTPLVRCQNRINRLKYDRQLRNTDTGLPFRKSGYVSSGSVPKRFAYLLWRE